MVLSVLVSLALKTFELCQHLCGKLAQAVEVREFLAHKGGHGHFENARGPGVARYDSSIVPQHQNTCSQVVQNGL